MTMVKSLLLGSAAGLVAIAGAQAADLPVKAKPVQYVKICSLYGVGFYYIPGTDMCLKIGGWVRFEYGYGSNGSFAWGWANNNFNDRRTNNSVFRARGYITADARNQTEYGTVRSYIAVGLSENDVGLNTPANTFSANRAFIQWAGFTFGRAQSFYDFYSVPATSYWGAFPASDTGDPGWLVAGYTAQFGNGFSATLSAEQRRMTQIFNLTSGVGAVVDDDGDIVTPALISIGQVPGPGFPNNYGGLQWPDIVGNLRVDQAWGAAQIMGAIHNVNATYYGSGPVFGPNRSQLDPRTGHPDDKIGWVVGAGLKLNAPFIGQGDYFQSQVNYTEGALRYVFMTPNSTWSKVDGDSIGFGVLSDAVYGGQILGNPNAAHTGSDLELTTAWGVNAAYEHFWNPRWRTSLYGGYAEVSYNDNANALLCSADGGAHPNVGGCDMNWQTWWIGSRTQWNITKEFYMGLDVMYSKLQTAVGPWGNDPGGSAAFRITPPGSPAWVSHVDDVDNFQVRFRVHRDFYP